MINKKLNLFLIENKKIINNSVLNKNNNKNNFNIIKYFNLKNYKEIKALLNLFKCISLLNKLNKSIFIYNDNFITIINKNNFYKNLLTYKYVNIELMSMLKIYIYMNTSIFINASSSFIKFKSEYETYSDIFFDCYHHPFKRKKANSLVYKMYFLVLYFLI
uniref:Orf160 n=1 Tax=Tetrahymena pyriformis TaxID=5908 RepID=Q9XMR5_TETPY|nr:orf160 [Tetrahymena pyriformis]AAD41956.1 orf160 [Tetrahymena pyriformis]